MIKKMLLCFLCFCLFLSIPNCKKKLPTEPDIPELVAPTIEYFYASPTTITQGGTSTLAWGTSNATQVFINMLTGNLPPTGTLDVRPEETTTYILSAKNDAGVKISSCTVEIEVERWAILEVSTVPTSPTFYYISSNNTCYADFAVVVHETNGVGGQIDYVHIYGWKDDWMTCGMRHVIGGTFSANGSFMTPTLWVLFTCKAVKFQIVVKGEDMNGHAFDLSVWFGITWNQGKATAQVIKKEIK